MFLTSILTSVTLLSFYYAVKRYWVHSNTPLSTQQLSWILSSIVSLVLTMEGLFFALPEVLSTPNTAALAMGDSLRAQMSCDFFIAFCITELVVGSFDYPLSFLEGWFHHLFYLAMLLVFRIVGCSNAFWIFTWCEVPTLIMACKKMGVLIPRWIFKVTFWVFRIVLFTATLASFFMLVDRHLLYYTLLPASAVWMIHIWWGIKLLRYR